VSLFGTSGPPARSSAGDRARRRLVVRRRRIAALAAGTIAIIVVVLVLTLGGGGGVPAPPAPGVAVEAHSTDPFSYATSKADDFTARAATGNAHVLFTKSPGGALATARRVAAFRPMIDQAVKGTGIDPNLLEGLVFVESAGRPDVIAGTDPADASGLTQILAETGTSLLGMHIDLARSRALTRRIDAVAAGAKKGNLRHLEAERAAADQRFDPRQALAATVRYLQTAEHTFHREDLAFESYHMGIGNLSTVLSDYDGDRAVPYVQLYFDVGPERHAKAFRLLESFGDDSSLYWWRILGAVQIMHLFRTDRAALRKFTAEQLTDDAGATVLHPPGDPTRFADPSALSHAYQDRALVPLPRNAAALGLAYAGGMGSGAAQLKVPRALYRGLRPVALRLLIELAGRIRSLSGAAPLHVGSTVSDVQYQKQQGIYAPLAATGWSFDIDRDYRTGAQAQAFQELLDRLQSLNLIAWAANGPEIEITVASDASAWRG
jgi:soluble lytic murein transglycosylase-like protein